MDLIDGSPKEWAFYRVLPNCTEFRGSRGVFGMNFFFWGGRLCGSVLWLVALRRRIWVALVCGTDRGGVSAKRATEFYRVSRTHHVDGKWLAGNVPGRRQFKGSSHERWWLRRRGSRGRVPSFFFFTEFRGLCRVERDARRSLCDLQAGWTKTDSAVVGVPPFFKVANREGAGTEFCVYRVLKRWET